MWRADGQGREKCKEGMKHWTQEQDDFVGAMVENSLQLEGHHWYDL